MILHRAKGGYSSKAYGKVIGRGKISVAITSPISVLKMEMM